jgi:hypothetical protein
VIAGPLDAAQPNRQYIQQAHQVGSQVPQSRLPAIRPVVGAFGFNCNRGGSG